MSGRGEEDLPLPVMPEHDDAHAPAAPRPALARRGLNRFIAALLGCMLLTGGTGMLTHFTAINDAWVFAAMMLIVPVTGLFGLSYLGWRRRCRDADHRLCLGCGYPLVHAPGAGRCPECGEPYELDDTRQAWRGYWNDDEEVAPPAAPAAESTKQPART